MRTYFSEAEYSEQMRTQAEPVLAAARREVPLFGYDGTPLFALRYDAEDPRGTVLMIHGFTESTEKFREIIYYFLRENFSVLIYDQRGHGHSTRTADASVTHVDRFEDYVKDAERVMAGPLADCPAPYDLFAHSMGGAVAALLLERNPDFFRRALLSSPMIGLQSGGVPAWVNRTICAFCKHTGRAKKRIFVAGPAPKDDEEAFAQSAGHSRARFDYYNAQKRADPLLNGGAPTYSWSLAALGVTRTILAKGAPERIKTAVRLCSADEDTLVSREAQQQFVKRVANGEFFTFATRHEIYNAKDDVAVPYFENVLDFFTA